MTNQVKQEILEQARGDNGRQPDSTVDAGAILAGVEFLWYAWQAKDKEDQEIQSFHVRQALDDMPDADRAAVMDRIRLRLAKDDLWLDSKHQGFALATSLNIEMPPRAGEPLHYDPPDDDDGAKKPGRPRKAKLLTEDYIRLLEQWGHNARLNLCNDDVEISGKFLDDIMLDQITAKVRDFGTLNNVTINVAHAAEAMTTMAAANAYHPIRDYLESLTWDGGEHIKKLADHFVDDKGNFPKWLRHWLAGAVAKIYDGFQNPMLVLDGPQDEGKSFFARWLCPIPDYFTESAIYPENKDCRLRLIKTWLWEVSELGTTTRKADVEALKAFLTLQNVRERKPYGKRDIIKPSLASFIGTVNNESGFLVDRTGNRRFLACTLTGIDWTYTEKVDVDQVWAEAVELYRKDDWKLKTEDKTRRDEDNEDYLVDDPIEAYIALNYTFTKNPLNQVALHAILSDLAIYQIKPSRATTMTIAGIMKKEGATKSRPLLNGKKQRVYSGVKRDVKAKDAEDKKQTDDDQQTDEEKNDNMPF